MTKILLTTEEVTKALKKKGFVQLEEKSEVLTFQPSQFFNFRIRYCPPLESPLTPHRKALLAKSMGITVPFFLDMVACHKGQSDYEAELRKYRANIRSL